jgi:hypothetical protein
MLNQINRKNRKVPVSVYSQKTEINPFVSDSFETSFGSCFGYIEMKPVLQDTLAQMCPGRYSSTNPFVATGGKDNNNQFPVAGLDRKHTLVSLSCKISENAVA